MTIEDVMREVEEETGNTVTPETELKDVVGDSLDFLALILRISAKFGHIPDSAVPGINTVNDLYVAAKGE